MLYLKFKQAVWTLLIQNPNSISFTVTIPIQYSLYNYSFYACFNYILSYSINFLLLISLKKSIYISIYNHETIFLKPITSYKTIISCSVILISHNGSVFTTSLNRTRITRPSWRWSHPVKWCGLTFLLDVPLRPEAWTCC